VINNLKISIIILYGNPWPVWFKYFLRSCETNKSIEWLIFSENDKPETNPDNVRFVKITINDLLHRVKDKIGIEPFLVHPFKFSDFKPAYGLIFNDYIKDSAFWGYCDIDLIFGNFSKFITDDIIENFDFISPSADFFPGHFLLMRNVEKVKNLFKLAWNWKDVLTKPECYCFDEKICLPPIQPDPLSVQKALKRNVKRHLREYGFIRNPFFHLLNQGLGGIRQKKKISLNEIKDFNSAINYSRFQGNIRTLNQQWFSDDIIKLRDHRKSFRIDWKEGRLFDGQNELLYFHFPLSKYSSSFKIYEIDKSYFSLINEHIEV
jgi:hypothetical protein